MIPEELLNFLSMIAKSQPLTGTATVVTLGSAAFPLMGAAVNKIKSKKNQKDLQELNPKIDYEQLPPEWERAYDCAEKLCLEWKEQISGATIFTEEMRDRIIGQVAKKCPEANIIVSDLQRDFAPFFDELEELLNELYSPGEKQIIHQLEQKVVPGIEAANEKLDNLPERVAEKVVQKLETPTPKPELPQPMSKPQGLHTANQLYADSFKKVLPFHQYGGIPNWELVTLENLFVMPKYVEVKNGETSDPKDDLEQRLSVFARSKSRILLIEGDAGTGKSTLTGWINRKALAEPGFLNGCTLLTVRLRDLASDGKEELDLTKFGGKIISYLNLTSITELLTKYSNGILWLDGFDELCMTEGKQGSHNSISGFLRNLRNSPNFKVVITSRRGYLVQDVDESLVLEHFDEDKRIEWMKAYQEKCKQEIKPFVETFIREMKRDGTSNICDTPFTLYLLAANKMEENVMGNAWAIYHSIFTEKTKETYYNAVLSKRDNEETAHPASEDWETHYRVCQEIAYWMYERNNEQLYVTRDNLEAIVTEMDKGSLSNQALKSITEHCYPLCSYWKENAVKGAVEFYHNNIRDYFLCEKICYELDKLYKGEWDEEETIKKLCELFRFGVLEGRVCNFIEQRTKYFAGKGENSRFDGREQAMPHLPGFFEKMLTDGRVFSQYAKLEESKNPIRTITNILGCIAEVFWAARAPRLKDSTKEKMKWWNNVSRVNENGMLRENFKKIFIRTTGAFADFQRVYLQFANLRGADLWGSDLRGADLLGSDLQGADLQYADLQDANLQGADLQDADLQDAYLGGAELTYAILPDGFSSDDQKEQIDHLKSRNIEGLII